MRRFFLSLFLLLFALPAAGADLGHSGAWRMFRAVEANEPLCYMIAHPVMADKTTKPAKTKIPRTRGKKKAAASLPREAYIMITFRPAENLFPVFSYSAGAILKDNSEAIVMIDKQPFPLFAVQDGAWARSGPVDQALTKAVRKGKIMNVTASMAKGVKLADRFSLQGSEMAYRKIARACGIH